MPSEFSDKAYETVDEFIRKTRDLDYEIVLYFDYVTGEVHKCAKGDGNNVKLNFEENLKNAILLLFIIIQVVYILLLQTKILEF